MLFKALIDSVISHDEYTTIFNERVKEDIRNMKSQKNDAEKDKMDRTRQKNQNV